MKRVVVYAVVGAMLLCGCNTYTGSGAYTGASFGSILGSAIGGIADGPRGSDIGTIVGMAGGAAVGAVVGNVADRQAQAQVVEHREAVKARRAQSQGRAHQENDDLYASGALGVAADTVVNYHELGAEHSGFDPNNGGDDRLYDFNGTDYQGDVSTQRPTENMPLSSSVEELASAYRYAPEIVIRNARFIDDNGDGKIERGELCRVIFEVMNRGHKTLYDVVPTVVEATGMKHLYISPSMHVEKIAPGKGIRYTALIKADKRLKAGTAKICVSVIQGGKAISKVSEFNIPTVK